MNKPFFGSNLKMYKNSADTLAYLSALSDATEDIRDELERLFIIPSFTSLRESVAKIDQNKILLGAQNMSWEEQGQFTGEISPLMLQEVGVGLIMIGHSERRHVLRETDQEENLKVKASLAHGFHTLLCIGETAEQKDYGISAEVLRSQIKIGFHGVSAESIPHIWVAYEPVWSIGVGGTPASEDYAQKMHRAMRECLIEVFGPKGADIPLLYGGSVNPDNCEALIVQPDIDGLFVGRAAWEADKFSALIRKSLKALGK